MSDNGWDFSSFFDGLDRIDANLEDRAAAAVDRGTEVIAARARELAPKETGRLAGSGGVTVTGTGFGARGQILFPGPYALYQEKGVFYRRAHVEPDGHVVPERFGAPLRHDNGQSFYLETAVRTMAAEAVSVAGRALFEGL